MIRDSGIQITRFIAVFSNHDLSFLLHKKLKGSLLVRCADFYARLLRVIIIRLTGI